MLYSLTVTQEPTGNTVVQAIGPFALAAYAAKVAELDAGNEYAVRLTEYNPEVGTSEDARTLLSLAADGETVRTVLDAKIRKERKLVKDSEPAQKIEAPEDNASGQEYVQDEQTRQDGSVSY
jgi:hypothetical protein